MLCVITPPLSESPHCLTTRIRIEAYTSSRCASALLVHIVQGDSGDPGCFLDPNPPKARPAPTYVPTYICPCPGHPAMRLTPWLPGVAWCGAAQASENFLHEEGPVPPYFAAVFEWTKKNAVNEKCWVYSHKAAVISSPQKKMVSSSSRPTTKKAK